MTGWSRKSIQVKPGPLSSNAARNRRALAAMTEAQRITGKTAEELRAEQQAQRERVLRRHGMAA